MFRQTINERMRALIRTEFGWSQEEVASIADDDLARAIDDEAMKRDLYAKHLTQVPEWIAGGYLTEAESERMTRFQLREFAKKVKALMRFDGVEEGVDYYLATRRSSSMKVTDEKGNMAATTTTATIDTLKREEQLALHADMLAIIAAQQVQIDQLRQEVASLKNANLAVFGHQKVIEQLTTVPRDFEGVEVHMTLEEQVTEAEEGSNVASETRSGSIKDARDATAGIEGLASLIAGLNVTRKVNLDALNDVSRKMSERAKTLMKTRSRGEVHVKLARVTGGTRNLAAGSGAVRNETGVREAGEPEIEGAVEKEVDPTT